MVLGSLGVRRGSSRLSGAGRGGGGGAGRGGVDECGVGEVVEGRCGVWGGEGVEFLGDGRELADDTGLLGFE